MNYNFKTQQSVEPTKGQTFPTTKPVYRLNKATGRLEETEEVIILQDVIDSCLETCLDRTLDRLMPKIQASEDLAQLDTMRDDLDFAMETCELAEQYREKYKLPDSYSVNDIFDHVAKEAEILKAKIETVQATKKEVKNETKETVQKSE